MFLIGVLEERLLKKLDDALFANYDTLFFVRDSGNITFFSDEIGILSVYFDKINFDDANFEKDDLETIIHVRLMT